MSRAVGIAGSPLPEATGAYLVGGGVEEALWYASFGKHARVDVWEVDASGLRLEEAETGWLCREVIPPQRLMLVEAALTPAYAERRLGLDATETDKPSERGLTGYLEVVLKKLRPDRERQGT